MQELEKVLEEIENERESYEAVHVKSYEKGLRFAAEAIRKHMDAGWIPVEDERRPEVGENVLGTNKYDEVLVYHYGWNSPHTRKMFFHLCGAAADIIAWRTLPEPYRPEVTKP